MSEENLVAVECTDVISVQEPIIQLTENGVEGFEVLCRLCANRNEHLIPIYSEEGITNDLADKMNLYLPIKVTKTDLLPLQCCFQCASTVLAWHELVIASVEADRRLRDIQTEVEKQIAAQLLDSETDVGQSQAEDEKSFTEEEKCTEETLPAEDKKLTDTKNKKYPRIKVRTDILEKDIKKISFQSRFGNEKNKLIEKNKTKLIGNKKLNLVKEIKKLSSESQIENKKSKSVNKNAIKPIKNEDTNLVIQKPISELLQVEINEAEDDEFMLSPPKQTLECADCGKHFIRKPCLQRHIRIHRDERPCICHICGKNFRTESGLSRHIRHVHSRIKTFTCDFCPKSFATSATRDDHRRIHTNEKPFICQICGKRFGRKAALYIHSTTHSDVYPFSCHICEKKFKRKQEHVSHMTKHSGLKPYQCDKCDKSFRMRHFLNNHLLVHSDQKPFTCQICDLSFKQARYLKKHKLQKHANE